MRVGKWVRVFDDIVPVPRTLAVAFGLRQGSQLHIAPVHRKPATGRGVGTELIVSPVPASSWKSVCRLSVRLQHQPRALYTATEFLRTRRINIILTEACATYQERAHWDATCDLRYCSVFRAVDGLGAEEYARVMEGKVLPQLTAELNQYADEHPTAFLQGHDRHAQFSELTGLNFAAFICDRDHLQAVDFKDGAIRIPRALREYIDDRDEIGAQTPCAVITGNTEQRYLRIEFLDDAKARQLFVATVDNELPEMVGDGIGLLNRLLQALPAEIDLIRVSNFITEKNGRDERGRIQLLGYWPRKARISQKRFQLRECVNAIKVEDLAGSEQTGCLKLVDFNSAEGVLPRVFISYPLVAESQMNILRTALVDEGYRPVLGTGWSGDSRDATGQTLSRRAFVPIDGCVGFVGLWTRRDEFSSKTGSHFGSPWAIAEEAYAWSRGLAVFRLMEKGVEGPNYEQLETHSFEPTEDGLQRAVYGLIRSLNNFRASEAFNAALRRTRTAFEPRHYSE